MFLYYYTFIYTILLNFILLEYYFLFFSRFQITKVIFIFFILNTLLLIHFIILILSKNL
jgi:hypothetical protein